LDTVKATFKLSSDKRFEEKLMDVVGLYLNPPEQAVVLCMDEKSQIQALDRTQPSLLMKKGRAGTMTQRSPGPTCRLHTGRPWLSPSSRSLPRTTVQRVSLANTRRHASTWSSRSRIRARRASPPTTFTTALNVHEYTSWPSRVMCHPHENTRRAPGGAWSSTA